MAFPIAAALAVYGALKGSGGGQQQPGFQLPQFGRPSDAMRRSPIYSAFMPTLTADTGRGPGFQLPPTMLPQQPAPTLNTPTLTEDSKKNPDKLSTKDYITQAFLGNLIQSAFGPKQPSPYTFSPPVFR